MGNAHRSTWLDEIIADIRRTNVSPDMALLGLQPGFTSADLKAAFARKIRETHPDVGGSEEAVRAVIAARQRLEIG